MMKEDRFNEKICVISDCRSSWN